jgi:acyl-CoA synthetase (AMP-forming)/AMP-acid ligase II
MDSTLAERVVTKFDPDFFSNQYGCTEAYAPLGQTNLQEGDDPTVTGPANVMHRTRIVELEGTNPDATVDPGREGELVIGMDSPTVFSGYWEKSKKTNEVVHDGWFFTGDVAYETDAGNVVITGRVDDMIISGGENIYPSNIEDVLAAHSDVADAAVIGVPDDEWGETSKAFVVPESEIDETTLDQWCLESDDIADFKRPRQYAFIDELPRNPSGKVTRYKIREEH